MEEFKLILGDEPEPAAEEKPDGAELTVAEGTAEIAPKSEIVANIMPDDERSQLQAIANAQKPDTSALTPAELQQIAAFSEKIDLNNSSLILQYGNQAQKKMAGFSEQALSNVRTKDVSVVGELISGLVVELQGFSADGPKKKGLFQKQRHQVAEMKARYDVAEKNVDKIAGVLEGQKVTLMKDVAMLDQMFKKNQDYFKELTMYILAGRQKLEQVINEEMPVLWEKARVSGRAEDAQAASYLADTCNRFDKKLHDLELTRTVSLQMAPQIRLIQSTNTVLIEKIQTSIVNTIPLWKNQMVLALGMQHTQSAIKAQREVTDITNQLLRKNAEALKINTIEAAKENERAIVDIETLKYTNQSLISTLDEVMKIQTEGRQKRRDAEVQLRNIEEELKQKLLQGSLASAKKNPEVGTDEITFE